jgi:hypothetical protein
VHCDVLTIPEDDQQAVFVTADPGSSSARALRRLGQSFQDRSLQDRQGQPV